MTESANEYPASIAASLDIQLSQAQQLLKALCGRSPFSADTIAIWIQTNKAHLEYLDGDLAISVDASDDLHAEAEQINIFTVPY